MEQQAIGLVQDSISIVKQQEKNKEIELNNRAEEKRKNDKFKDTIIFILFGLIALMIVCNTVKDMYETHESYSYDSFTVTNESKAEAKSE